MVATRGRIHHDISRVNQYNASTLQALTGYAYLVEAINALES
jgi:hypothetical protein